MPITNYILYLQICLMPPRYHQSQLSLIEGKTAEFGEKWSWGGKILQFFLYSMLIDSYFRCLSLLNCNWIIFFFEKSFQTPKRKTVEVTKLLFRRFPRKISKNQEDHEEFDRKTKGDNSDEHRAMSTISIASISTSTSNLPGIISATTIPHLKKLFRGQEIFGDNSLGKFKFLVSIE